MKYTDLYYEGLKKVTERIPNVQRLQGKALYITGATGLICSAIADILLHLNKNCGMKMDLIFAGRSSGRVEKRFYPYKLGEDYQFSHFDALGELLVSSQYDYIIHGAGNADSVSIMQQPVETMLANIIGLRELLEVARKSPNCRLLYTSSSEVYGKNAGNGPATEADYGFEDILNPRSAYPSSKRAAETLCIAYAEEYGVDTVIVRPGHIFGETMTPGDSRVPAQFARNAISGENIVIKSAGSQIRSYCSGLDCASAMLAVLLNGETKNVYNISNPMSVISIRELAEAFAAAAGTNVVFAHPSDAEKKGYSLMENASLNADKLLALGWRPTFSLAEAVRLTLNAAD